MFDFAQHALKPICGVNVSIGEDGTMEEIDLVGKIRGRDPSPKYLEVWVQKN